MTDQTTAPVPALALPAIATACPRCGSLPGSPCTSHDGARTRRRDVHQARTDAHQEATR